MGLSKAFRVHIWPQLALTAEHELTGFNVCPAGFLSCFGSVLFYPLFPFGIEMFAMCRCVSALFNFLIFIGAHSEECESQRRLWTCIFQQC